jgi:hypothetical protein
MTTPAVLIAAERAAKRAKLEARAHFASLSAHGSGSAPPLPTPSANAPATSALPEQGNNTHELCHEFLNAEVSSF